MAPSDWIDVELVCAWPERAHIYKARVPRGTTAGELLGQSRVLERFPQLRTEGPALGVFGRKIEPAYLLESGDRVEVLRPLINDPRESRRRRAAQTAGSKR
jgi:putative ubiquitin-RnfH superfamily antitoxin RatB of RatAB toxin-antitoxin module